MAATPIVTVYSNPGCQPCAATKRWLAQHDIPFDDINLQADIEPHGAGANLEAARALGYREAPIVIASLDGVPGNELHWSGFNPNELAKLLERNAA